METSDAAELRAASASSASSSESLLVRQMTSLIDAMMLNELQSPSAVRDIAECMQMLSQAAHWTRGATGADPGECTEQGLAADSQETVEELFADSRFEIRRMLGHGGFGVVLLAFDKRLGREVALKVPRPEILASRSIRARFMREAQVAAALDHPHIVPTYDTGEFGPVWFITSRYINGPTLAEWMRQQSSPVSSRQAAKLVALLAEALQHAHARGILHCDLKPANVLLEPTEAPPDRQFPFSPRLSDFGLGRYVHECDASLAPDSLVGTPRYMAPEQAACRHKDVGIQTDVYALGTLLFELLTGRLPFAGRDNEEILRQIITEPAPVAALQEHRVARDLQAICLKCLEKAPAARYESAAALAADLGHFLDDQPVAARPCGPAERFLLWCKRRPQLAALFCVLGLVSFAGVAGIAWQWNRAEHHLAATRSLLYDANVQLAGTAWEQRNVRAVNAALAPIDAGGYLRDDPRGWEWYYLHRLCHQDLATFQLGQSIDSMFACPAAHIVFVGTSKGRIAAIESRKRKILWVINPFNEKIVALGATPDGRRLAAIDRNGRLKVWKHGSSPQLVEQAELNRGEIMAAAFDAGLERLAIGVGDHRIHVLRLDPLERVSTCEGHSALVKSLCFASNQFELLSSSEDGSVRLWNIESGKQAFAASHPDGQWLLQAAISSDGQWIAAGAQDGKLLTWKVGSQHPAVVRQAHAGNVGSVRFSPQDDVLVTASDDRSVRRWSFPDIQPLDAFWGHENTTSEACAISADQIVSTGMDGAAKLWNSPSDLLENPPPWRADVCNVVFDSDGETLATRLEDGTVVVDTWPERREVYRFTGPPDLDALAYCAKGSLCAVARNDGAIEVWQGQRRIHELSLHAQPVKSLSFSSDARILAAGSEDGSVSVWDPRTGVLKHHIRDKQGPPVLCVAVHPHDLSLVALAGEQIQIIAADSGRIRRSLNSHNGRIYCAAFDRAGTLLAVGDKAGDITIWDLATFKPRATLRGHTDRVFGCCFAPDGRRIVSCGRDGKIRWWNVKTGREVCVLRGDWGSLECLALSPDGWSLLSVSESKDLRVWDPRQTNAPTFAASE